MVIAAPAGWVTMSMRMTASASAPAAVGSVAGGGSPAVVGAVPG